MGIKIHELNSSLIINNDDVLPLTQDIDGSNRITLKTTTLQIKDNFNAEINSRINNLELELSDKKIDTSIFNKFLRVDGTKSMYGDLYMDNSTIINYSAKIIYIQDNYTLQSSDNSSVLLVNKDNFAKDPDARVEVTINENSLPVGFNLIIIQTGNTQVKLKKIGSVEIWNSDNFKTTKGQYSSMNICILKPNKIWVTGDLVYSFT